MMRKAADDTRAPRRNRGQDERTEAELGERMIER
jgi:hypothetical protein